MNRLAVWVLSDRGRVLGKNLISRVSGAVLFYPGTPRDQSADSPEIPFASLKQAVTGAFHEYDAHLFIMAAGIAVRMTGPLLVDKRTDPAVVVIDERARHVISLVSGHLGGANDLAEDIALITGAEPVITTATDLSGKIAFDTLARRMAARVEPGTAIKATSTALLAEKPVALICDSSLYDRIKRDFPSVVHFKEGDIRALDRFSAACVVSDTILPIPASLKKRVLFLRPPILTVGIGCNRGTNREEITNAVRDVFKSHNLSLLSVFRVASVDRKASEPGLAGFAQSLDAPFVTFNARQINTLFSENGNSLSPPSKPALKHVGVKGVAEPAALLAAGDGAGLIVPKQKMGNVTVAVARKPLPADGFAKGHLAIVGIGPGDTAYLTCHARRAIEAADILAGYMKYMALIAPFTAGKKLIKTGMTRETERVDAAIEAALRGNRVALIASGDAGIYGLAGLAMERAEQRGGDLEISISPGVTAAVSAASVVGAPLTNDYITLSLSDLLTPTETVLARIRSAAASGMVTVVYNPKSKKRTRLIRLLQEEFLKFRSPETPVAIITHALRAGQNTAITTLDAFLERDISMNSIVIVGNADTLLLDTSNGKKMVTQRGYERKQETGSSPE